MDYLLIGSILAIIISVVIIGMVIGTVVVVAMDHITDGKDE